MAIRDFFTALVRLPADGSAGPGLSRRDMLSGLGLAGALAVAGPALLNAGTAEAAEPIETDSGVDAEITPAQYRRRRHSRRGWGPGHGHRRRPGRRWAHRDLYARCRRDRRFRFNNPGLCRRVLYGARPRPGACVHFGPVMFCG